MASEHKNLWQMLKFAFFSISAGLIQAGSFALFQEAMHLNYWASYLPSLLLSVLWNFTLNRRYTFRSDANVPRAMLLVLLFYAVFTPLTTLGGDALSQAGWNDYLVLGLTMVLNFVLEYLYQRLVVYRRQIDTNDIAKRAQEREAKKAAKDAEGKK